MIFGVVIDSMFTVVMLGILFIVRLLVVVIVGTVIDSINACYTFFSSN